MKMVNPMKKFKLKKLWRRAQEALAGDSAVYALKRQRDLQEQIRLAEEYRNVVFDL